MQCVDLATSYNLHTHYSYYAIEQDNTYMIDRAHRLEPSVAQVCNAAYAGFSGRVVKNLKFCKKEELHN